MAASLRFTLLLGMCLVACTETAPEEGTAAASSTSSTGGAGGATEVSGGEMSGATGMGGSVSPTVAESSASLTTSSSASAPASTNLGGTGAAGSAGPGGTGTGGSGPAAGGSTAGAGGSAGSVAAGGGGSGAGGTSEPGVLESFTLAVIGSSTAAGEGASSSSDAWVSLLASELKERVVGDFASNNLSVGGYATSHLMPGSNSDGNVDDAVDGAPNLIIVALAGSNDLSNGVSTETFLTRLATIRDAAVEAGVPVFFVGTAPKDLSADERAMLLDWTNLMRQELDTCWTPLSAEYSPCFIDVFATLADSSLGIADEYSSGDGIHLNDAGHRRIFEIAESVVRPYVCAMTECTP